MESQQQKPELQLSDNARVKLHEVIMILETEMMDDWEKLRKKHRMDEVELFGKKIRNTGEKYQFGLLTNLGMHIIQAVQAFDIGQIRKLVLEFPEIVAKLKEMQ